MFLFIYVYVMDKEEIGYMKKIYLDVGYGGVDLGVVVSGLYEKDLVLVV